MIRQHNKWRLGSQESGFLSLQSTQTNWEFLEEDGEGGSCRLAAAMYLGPWNLTLVTALAKGSVKVYASDEVHLGCPTHHEAQTTSVGSMAG